MRWRLAELVKLQLTLSTSNSHIVLLNVSLRYLNHSHLTAEEQMKKLKACFALGALLLASVSLTSAGTYEDAKIPVIAHVLLISVDGLHAVDFANCASGL